MRKIRLAAVIALSAVLAAAQMPRRTAAPVVEVSAQGKFAAQPDVAHLRFQVQAVNKSLRSAYAAAQRQAEQVRALLRQNGITPQAAHWSGYQSQPQRDWKTHQLTGYQVATTVMVEVTDFGKIAPLVDQAGQKELAAGLQINFELKNTAQAKAQAIADGYRRARQEAVALAKAAGVPLGRLLNASVGVSAPQMFAPKMALARAAPAPVAQFTPQLITVTANIHATFALAGTGGQ